MNINFMEVFIAGLDLEFNEPFAFFVLSTHFMHAAKDINRILTNYPDIDLSERNYKPGGVDHVTINLSDLKQAEDMLLNEPVMVRSIKELNLRLMRNGPSIFSRYHCYDLVTDVIS